MIREAKTEDIPKIVLLKLEMFKAAEMEHKLHDDFVEKAEKTYQELYHTGKAKHFLLEKDDEIIACAGAFIKEDIPYCFYKDPQYGFIGDVFVETTYRRNGYGRLLTNCAIDWLLKMEIKTIRLLASENAKKLYQELGFQGTDEMVLYR
ncbi:GNAT family N-acetyltransferase [Gracilibacillus kekensis]|uniref:Acetyltransferase (GNAT) family protein n=1 Tax=Gracilibacillus kekensis TaxID=1027249 RepID=A0A1M7IWY8_9BACI|nr:GNAT family N-acetyltransferase [Gracilibacillus kekensis]SHM45246.1 Acetyltransferase (GNAT) family protein [Gracilibacillus kekensis]